MLLPVHRRRQLRRIFRWPLRTASFRTGEWQRSRIGWLSDTGSEPASEHPLAWRAALFPAFVFGRPGRCSGRIDPPVPSAGALPGCRHPRQARHQGLKQLLHTAYDRASFWLASTPLLFSPDFFALLAGSLLLRCGLEHAPGVSWLLRLLRNISSHA